MWYYLLLFRWDILSLGWHQVSQKMYTMIKFLISWLKYQIKCN